MSLPPGGGALRGIDETFEANPVTGTASLSVPFGLSPGRQGQQPSLALTYDSGGGNGPYGLGWSVPVPRIRRKTDRGLPRYDDVDDPDTFVVAGGEDLVPEAGVDRPDGDWLVRRYRPRAEASFARIERFTQRATGEVWWQIRSRDNTVSTFGASAAARIADPDDPRRTAEWCLERTEHELGHVTVYDYKAEDEAGVDLRSPVERMRTRAGHRCTQLYLKRVRYGNAEPLSDSAFRFEVVLDYGEHPDDTPVESAPWAVRDDPSSSFRTGFDVRTRRRCQRVLMFHAIPELADRPVLVSSTALSYEATPQVSLLREVQRTCFDEARQPQSLPPVTFEYSRPVIGDTLRVLDDASLENLPAGLGAGDSRWLDLDGEGLAGVLTGQADAWFYKRNLGAGSFGPLERVAERPVLATVASLQDLDGNGRLDVVVLDGPAPGLQERRTDGRWSPLRPFGALPNLDWSDPHLRFIDLDGDGLADVLLTEDHALRWYRSQGRDGFDQAHTRPLPSGEDDGPRLLFADGTESVFTADMTGDGLIDLVRVRNSEVSYWPNRGYGNFGARVVMTRPPVFDRPDLFDPRRVRLADLDGTGSNDLVYLGGGDVLIWFNEAGNGWSPPRRLTGISFPDDVSTAQVVDLFGTGTACLVWSSPLPQDAGRPLRYVDLMTAGKPWLLTRIENGVGAERTLEYTPSTHSYLADRAAGCPWATRLPFPVHTLTTVTVEDRVTGARFVCRYSYHHGYFDGVEREFRGFGRVEQIDTGTVSDFDGAANGDLVHHLPPVRTVTWYHTGAWLEHGTLLEHYRKEFWAGDPGGWSLPESVVPVGLAAADRRDAARALRGRVLRQEVFADDGSDMAGDPYTVAETNYEVRRLQAGDDHRPAVFHVVPGEAITSHYERDPLDPRLQQQLTLEVDEYGAVVRAATVAYPRRSPACDEQGRTWITVTEKPVANRDEAARLHLGVPVQTDAWELTGWELTEVPSVGRLSAAAIQEAFDAAVTIPFEATASPPAPAAAPEKRPVRRAFTLYATDDDQPVAKGELGDRLLVYESYEAAFTPGLLTEVFGTDVAVADLEPAGYAESDGGWWARSGRERRDPGRFWLPVSFVDPFGNTTALTYDPEGLFVVTVVDPAGNRVTVEPDYRVLAPWKMTDPNGHATVARFDAFGQVTAVAIVGRDGEGDTLDDPAVRFSYDVWAWHDRGMPVSARTESRETHGDPATRWQAVVAYTGGLGHPVLTKARVAPGPSGGERWVGNGRTVFDNKGNPVKQYEPYFAANDGYDAEAELVEQGVTQVTTYDPAGRVVRVDRPDGTFRTTAFDAWSSTLSDENDTVLDSAWYAGRAGGGAGAGPQRAALLTAAHAGTPAVVHLDPLARPFLTIEDNGSAGRYETRTELDLAGNALTVTDARGVRTTEGVFDMRGRALRTTSPDAGETRVLPDAADQPVRAWRSGDSETRIGYDALRRPVRQWAREGGLGERLVQVVTYGDTLAPDDDAAVTAGNLRTRAVRTHDTAGVVTIDDYDFKGNALHAARTLLADVDTPVDWATLEGLDTLAGIDAAAAALLETENHGRSAVYDALNRVTRAVAPDGSATTVGFDEGGRLRTVDVDAVPHVTGLTYNARGQREQASYGNGVTTTYAYEPETFRLARLTTTRARDSARLQDLSYTYDPVGNIVQLTDSAQDTLFFDNAEVGPTAHYAYDPIYRLTAASGREHASVGQPTELEIPYGVIPHPNDSAAVRGYTETYAYDEVGNLVAMTHSVHGGIGGDGVPVAGGTLWRRRYQVAADSNRLLATSRPGDPDTVHSDLYSHNDRGAMVSMPHLPSMERDFRDQLRRVDLGGGNEAVYHYDAAGMRVRKVVRRGANTEETLYLEGYELYRRHVGSRLDSERHTLHVADDQRRIAMVETQTVAAGAAVATPAHRLRHQLDNHLGSARLELDETGAIISHEEYHPYGTTAWHATASGVEVSARRYRYTGKEKDEETGLSYHGARYYASWLGRWEAADPAGTVDGLNRYMYTRANPVRHRDPSGMATSDEEAMTRHILTEFEARNIPYATQVEFYPLDQHGQRMLKAGTTTELYGKMDVVYVDPHDGQLKFIEVKGRAGSPRTVGQVDYHPHLLQGGGWEIKGHTAGNLNLRPGVKGTAGVARGFEVHSLDTLPQFKSQMANMPSVRGVPFFVENKAGKVEVSWITDSNKLRRLTTEFGKVGIKGLAGVGFVYSVFYPDEAFAGSPDDRVLWGAMGEVGLGPLDLQTGFEFSRNAVLTGVAMDAMVVRIHPPGASYQQMMRDAGVMQRQEAAAMSPPAVEVYDDQCVPY
ncbi:SpvB/TcaC N-terminal domain-containing protein [Micromonospora sp. NPDC049497]|uniref:SpvB/TcaC N-terminal domain-containing protein n=1 Tax=Micromonospora sp. NPDC049497 TaxID=3364273 RepID=UPI0037894F35